MKTFRIFVVLLLFLVAALLTSCGGGGGSGSSSAGEGIISLSLTDSTTEEYKAVYVTIDSVEVRVGEGGSWQVVATPAATYNLLELVNGVFEPLGLDSLPAGDYGQIRLMIGTDPDAGTNILGVDHPFANYVVTLTDENHELKIPSGFQTGLKIVKGFTINENQTTELILDFDAARSVVKAGSSGKYLLKPTIKVLATVDYASVSGIVVSAEVPLEGAFVSAQTTDDEASLFDQVEVVAGTLSSDGLEYDDLGEYALFLEPGIYNFVATKDGYLPLCYRQELTSAEMAIVDFNLVAIEAERTVAINLTISAAEEESYASLQVRQQLECGNGEESVIIKTIELGDGGSYEMILAPGNYTLIASVLGRDTVQTPLLIEDIDVSLDLVL